jgi:hypothetical protein
LDGLMVWEGAAGEALWGKRGCAGVLPFEGVGVIVGGGGGETNCL